MPNFEPGAIPITEVEATVDLDPTERRIHFTRTQVRESLVDMQTAALILPKRLSLIMAANPASTAQSSYTTAMASLIGHLQSAIADFAAIDGIVS